VRTNSGGEEVLLDVGGQDSTEAFEDVGHSDEAREILDGLLVGTLKRVVCSFRVLHGFTTVPLSDFAPVIRMSRQGSDWSYFYEPHRPHPVITREKAS
jgi:cytochrome b involved in lipid metabolism